MSNYIAHTTDFWDEICNGCIAILENACHATGMSYGMLNILIFVVLGPIASLSFAISTVAAYRRQKKTMVAFVILGVLCIFAIICLITTGLIR